MLNFFILIINVSAFIAIISYFVFCFGIIKKSKTMTNTDTYDTCDNQLKTCRVLSVMFVVLYWFIVSGKTTVECLKGYAKLSANCSLIGCLWIISAIVNIIVSLYIGINKRGKDEMAIMVGMRKSCFTMSAVFLILSFLLKVN